MAWNKVGNLKGPQGDKGEKGDAGLGITVGDGAPSGDKPVGSSYIDKATGDLYVFQASA